jgi:hypothetical protein
MSPPGPGVAVTLTWAEMLIAANIGCMRNVQSLKLGRSRTDILPSHQDGGMDCAWSSNIEGAAGEMVVAKHLGLFWSGAVGEIAADDVGGYQVKTNTSRRWDDLIIRKRNKPDRVYISVLSFVAPAPGTAKFIITGWIHGADAIQQKFWRDGLPGMPAYFVPRSVLHPIETLPPIKGVTLVPTAREAIESGRVYDFITGDIP